MSLLNNVELARHIENIKIKGTKEYIIKRQKMSGSYNGDFLTLDGKGEVFCMDGYCFSVGFGLDREILSSDIEMLEDSIRKKGSSSHIHFELTPYSNQTSLKTFQERGYTLDHILSVWVLSLKEWKSSNDDLKSDKVSIKRVTDDESYEWARTVALGFSNDDHITEDSIESVRCFLHLSNSAAFLLKENEENVAGGFFMMSDHLGEMFLTSTIHSHRGKGYQNLLIEERVKYAKSKGCTHLTVTTKPNSASGRNVERNGFKLAYNKVVMKSPILN